MSSRNNDGRSERYTIKNNGHSVSIHINDTNPYTRYRPARPDEVSSAVRDVRSNSGPMNDPQKPR